MAISGTVTNQKELAREGEFDNDSSDDDFSSVQLRGAPE
jgi:hypothetical protein